MFPGVVVGVGVGVGVPEKVKLKSVENSYSDEPPSTIEVPENVDVLSNNVKSAPESMRVTVPDSSPANIVIVGLKTTGEPEVTPNVLTKDIVKSTSGTTLGDAT